MGKVLWLRIGLWYAGAVILGTLVLVADLYAARVFELTDNRLSPLNGL